KRVPHQGQAASDDWLVHVVAKRRRTGWRCQSGGPRLAELLQLRYVVEDVHQTGAIPTAASPRLAGPQASRGESGRMSISRPVLVRDLGSDEPMPGACEHAHAFGRSLIREPDASNPHVRFDEREVETEHGEIFRHRQPKGPATRKAHLPHRAA